MASVIPQKGVDSNPVESILMPCVRQESLAHRTCSMCQLAHIALQRGRQLELDPYRKRFANDETANGMLHRSYRAPWDLNITL